jgi:hypothetical protein
MSAAVAIPIIVASAVIGAGAAVYSGYEANQAAKKEKGMLEDQGRLAQEEANREATLHARDVRRFQANQSLSFLANGVSLAGSPLLVAEDTQTQGDEEVASIRKSGAAQRELYNQRGVIARNQGRAALIGGIGQAAGIGASAAGSVGTLKAGA